MATKIKKIEKPKTNARAGLGVKFAKLCGLGFSRAEYNLKQKAKAKKK
jgi:hypothetical protein